MDVVSASQAAAVVVAAIAAATDVRTGLVPNWLTLPVLAAAPLVHVATGGWRAGVASLASALLCALVPYLLFRRGAAGGGDVKLFAALGALLGISLGIEAEMFTFTCAALFSLGLLAWRGRLVATLRNAWFLALNPLLPKRWRRDLTLETMTTIRLGAFVLLGTLAALAAEYLARRG